LFSCEKAFGAWPAIAVNVAVYSFVHLPKGKKETIGAIPLGFILCFLTLNTRNIWAAYWIHVVLALSNEWISLAIHPDMEVLLFIKK
jgi:membrane protease YdiL (CAAX protease family)